MKPEKARELEMKFEELFGGAGTIVETSAVRPGNTIATVTKRWVSPVSRQPYIVCFKTLKDAVCVTCDGPIGDLRIATTHKEADDLAGQIMIELEIEGRVVTASAAPRAMEKVRA